MTVYDRPDGRLHDPARRRLNHGSAMTSQPDDPPRRRSLGAQASAVLVVRVVCTAMGIVVFVLLTRSLSPANFGRFAIGIVLSDIGSMLVDTPLFAIQMREGAASPDTEPALARWIEARRTVLEFAVALILVVVALGVSGSTSGFIAMAIIISTVPMGGMQVGLVFFQQRRMLGLLAMVLLVQSVLWLAVAAVLAALGVGIFGFAVGYAASALAFSLTVRLTEQLARRGDPPAPDKWKGSPAIMKEAVQLSFGSILSTGYYKIDSVLVLRINGAKAGGIYALAYRFIDQGQILPLTLSNIFQPALAVEHVARSTPAAVFDRYLRITLILSIPSVVLGIILARWIVLTVFGQPYHDSVWVLRLLLLALVPISIGYVVMGTAVAAHRSRDQVLPAAIALVLSTIANILFLPIYGPRAAAIVTVAVEWGLVSMLYFRIRRPCSLHLPIRWAASIAAVTGVALGIAALARSAGGGEFTMAATFAVAFVGLVLGLKLTTLSEMLNPLATS